MKKYSITEISQIVGENRSNIARYIQRHNFKEININRPHKNSPKYYDEETLKIIKAEYLPKEAQQEYNKSVTASYSGVEQLLKEQLANERQDKEKLQEQNTELLKLLNQQQQLTLISNKKLEVLKLELEDPEQKNIEQEKKRKWYDLFRRKGE